MIICQSNHINTQLFQNVNSLRLSAEGVGLSGKRFPSVTIGKLIVQTTNVCLIHGIDQFRGNTVIDTVLLSVHIDGSAPLLIQIDVSRKSNGEVIFAPFLRYRFLCDVLNRYFL